MDVSQNPIGGLILWGGPSALIDSCSLYPGALPQADIERAFGASGLVRNAKLKIGTKFLNRLFDLYSCGVCQT
jgi:hypothetical protein